jgi:hypothetical protein
MQNKIKYLKQRIDKNYSNLILKYGDKCELAGPIVTTINLLINSNASDETISRYLHDIESSLVIIEEKIQSVENMEIL